MDLLVLDQDPCQEMTTFSWCAELPACTAKTLTIGPLVLCPCTGGDRSPLVPTKGAVTGTLLRGFHRTSTQETLPVAKRACSDPLSMVALHEPEPAS